MSLIKAKLAALAKIFDPKSELFPPEPEVARTSVPRVAKVIPVATDAPMVIYAPPEQKYYMTEPAEEPVDAMPDIEPVDEPVPEVEVFFDAELGGEAAEPVEVVATPVRKTALRMLAPRMFAAAAPVPGLSPGLQSSITNLQNSMNNFAPPFKLALNNTKVQEAGLADNATELQGLTVAQQIAAMEADLDAHAASSGA